MPQNSFEVIIKNDREIFMKGIDISYYYEDYSEYKIEELKE